jgi:hypothetical protein
VIRAIGGANGKSLLHRARRASCAPCRAAPDGGYLVVCGRLWRMVDPGLADAVCAEVAKALTAARRAVAAAKRSGDAALKATAHGRSIGSSGRLANAEPSGGPTERLGSIAI